VTAPPAPDGEGMLSVRDVRKAFGGVHALDGVSFDLARGECMGVIGPNGAGKTTLLDVISGFTVPDRGRVRAGGVELLGLPARGRAGAGIGRTFQAPRLLWQESVFDNVALGGFCSSSRRRAGRGPGGVAADTREIVMEILVTLGLDAHRRSYAADLSYGQQKITEIGRALAASPRFLLLDEPLAGLHPDEHGRMIGILRRITGLNVGVVLIEHNLGVVARTCDRVLALHHGAMVADGPVEDVYRSATVRQAYFGPLAVGGG
jgi:branched-chain amino acid transport system ATP-binding protein